MMFIVSVVLRGIQGIQFHFDHFKDADKYVVMPVSGESITINDDYGSKAVIRSEDVVGIFLTEIEREMVALEKSDMEKVNKDIRIRKKIAQDPATRLMGMQ